MSDSTQQERKTRTITLTDRAPVKIAEEDWPVIAHGSYYDHDGQVAAQANRSWRCTIRVRQHEDGRSIVYGTYDYHTTWQGARGADGRAGELLAAGDDLVGAIRRTAATLDAITGGEYTAHIGEAERSCIADLPAEEI